VTEIEVAAVLAHRFRVQGLAARAKTAAELAVLDTGIQDTPPGSAALALGARLLPGRRGAPPAATAAMGDDSETCLVWSVRGAPHVHRRADVPALAAALRPRDGADLAARLGGRAEVVPSDDEAGVAPLDDVARAMREVAGRRTIGKPDLSSGVTELVGDRLTRWCERCGSRHVPDALFRFAALPAGLVLVPGESAPPMLRAVARPRGRTGTAAGAGEPPGVWLARRVVRVLGPTTPERFAAWLGTTPAHVRPLWAALREELAEVRAGGRRMWLPAQDLPRLTDGRAASTADDGAVRLLPPHDPYLAGCDREFLVPDKARRAMVWRPVGSPGVVVRDGAVSGVWRHRAKGDVLTVTVTPFVPVTAALREALDAEALAVARKRGQASAAVVVEAVP
jgi:hypothetical protein